MTALLIPLQPMANSLSKVIERMRTSPQGTRFDDAVKVAESFFGQPRSMQGGSHLVFKMGWPGDPRVNLQRGKNGEAKTYQVRQLLQAIDKYTVQEEIKAAAMSQPTVVPFRKGK